MAAKITFPIYRDRQATTSQVWSELHKTFKMRTLYNVLRHHLQYGTSLAIVNLR